jgi:hypothetical protein
LKESMALILGDDPPALIEAVNINNFWLWSKGTRVSSWWMKNLAQYA